MGGVLLVGSAVELYALTKLLPEPRLLSEHARLIPDGIASPFFGQLLLLNINNMITYFLDSCIVLCYCEALSSRSSNLADLSLWPDRDLDGNDGA